MTSLPPSAVFDGIEKEKKPKQRQRVPLLCLNCKKRKVKCDKAKPACGGCIRNNVAHLCVYKDPPWLQNQTATKTPDSEASSPPDSRSFPPSSLHYLTQQREIDELRSQIRFWQSLPSFLYLPVTFLRRLCPQEIHSTHILKVDEIEGFRVSASPSHGQRAEFFSWISVIKLDPQLEALWYKITKLLTVYHNYKASLRNKGTNMHAPAPRKLPNGIKEIDFTVVAHSAEIKKTPCPVIECDFAFSNGGKEDLIESESVSSSSPGPSCPNPSEFTEPRTNILELIESVWSNTVVLDLGNQLDHQQVYSLIEYYFNQPHNCESRSMLIFYKKEILNSVRRDGSMINHNIRSDSLGTLSRSSIFLCMLSIIIHGSLQRLKYESSRDSSSGLSTDSFAHGVNLRGSRNRDWITAVHTLLLALSSGWHTSSAFVAVKCSLLNSIISLYQKQYDSSLTRAIFTSTLKLFFEIIGRDGVVDISRDPELIQAEGSVYSRRNTQLKLHFCYLWANLVRLSNLAALDFVPLVEHSAELDNLHYALALKIQAAKGKKSHSKYLEKHGGPNLLQRKLIGSYLISEILQTINRAATAYGSPGLLVSDVCMMRQNCEEWLDSNKEPASSADSLEMISSVSFLNCYLNYIILLHGEETTDENVIMACVPKIFTSLYELLCFLKSCVQAPPDKFLKHYTTLVVIEVLARIIQLVMGLLMRIHNQDTVQTYTLLRDTIQKHNVRIPPSAVRPGDVSIQNFVEIHLVELVNSNLETLQKCEYADHDYFDKLAKMWKFYLTFVKNSRKMLSVDYAKIHSNVPVFRSEPLNIRGCPVFQSDGTPKSALTKGKAGEFRRCPILHIMSPMPLENGIEGAGRITPPLMAKRRELKRECPFDSSATSKKPHTAGSLPTTKKTGASQLTMPSAVCPVNHGTVNLADMALVRQSQDLHRVTSQMTSSPTPPFPDLSSFMEHNLDFDFLENDLLMEQMSLVNDLDVRGLFMP